MITVLLTLEDRLAEYSSGNEDNAPIALIDPILLDGLGVNAQFSTHVSHVVQR